MAIKSFGQVCSLASDIVRNSTGDANSGTANDDQDEANTTLDWHNQVDNNDIKVVVVSVFQRSAVEISIGVGLVCRGLIRRTWSRCGGCCFVWRRSIEAMFLHAEQLAAAAKKKTERNLSQQRRDPTTKKPSAKRPNSPNGLVWQQNSPCLCQNRSRQGVGGATSAT